MTTRIRHLETHTVKTLTLSADGQYGTVLTTDGTGFGQPIAVAEKLQPGVEFDVELTNGTIITGILAGGTWILRKTDAELDAEHAAFVAGVRERERVMLEKNRADWEARQAKLPDWLQARLQHFHDKGGESFSLEGWGYELTVAELAALYAASDAEETPEITAYADLHGTSGNQHSVARALAYIYNAGGWEDVRKIPSALTPLTGDLDYSEAAAKNQEQNAALAASE